MVDFQSAKHFFQDEFEQIKSRYNHCYFARKPPVGISGLELIFLIKDWIRNLSECSSRYLWRPQR